MRLWPKHPGETKLLVFLFGGEIAPGRTITSVERSIVTAAGVDLVPDAVFSGAALIDNDTRHVLQRVAGGVLGCDYDIEITAVDSDGLRHLIPATLPVRKLR